MQPYGFSLLELYPDWWMVLLVVVGLSLLANGLARLLAKHWHLLPQIRQRDVHTQRTPRLGGLAMWLVAILGIVFLIGLDRTTQSIGLGMIVLLVFGLWDDLKGLSPGQQLIGQLLAATALVWGGVQIEYINVPMVGTLVLTGTTWVLPDWVGGGLVWPASALFTYVWVILLINVMNFFDGLDGLAGSVATTASAILFFVCLRIGLLDAASLTLIVAGVALGFLPWNWHPAKLFMGTVGSQMLGFLLAVAAILSGAKVATAILVLGIPLLDAIIVILRRIKAGVSPFKADQRHLHHRLLSLGLPIPVVVVIVNLIALFFGLLALRTQNYSGKGMLAIYLILSMLVIIAITYWLERRGEKS